MPVEIKKIIKYCEDYLKVDKWRDYCVNGLQVEGAERTSKIVTGVSLSRKLIEAAISKRAKMIMVHHGFFKSQFSSPPQIKGVIKNRLKMLLENDINLAGFHLPLDAHPVIGNNISLLKLFNLQKKGTLRSDDYGDLGFWGELKEPVKFFDFAVLVNEKLNTSSFCIDAGSKKIKTVGIISGGASPEYKFALEEKLDVYVCGDVREETVREIEEAKINFINAGHYNTEKLGIQNLGELVAKKFNVKVEFIDIPNVI